MNTRRLCVFRFSDPAFDQVKLRYGYSEHIACRVLNNHDLEFLTGDVNVFQTLESTHSVIHMHYECSRGQLSEAFNCDRAAKLSVAADPAGASKDLVIT